MTGPGAVPLYVQAGKVTPFATSISLSTASKSYSRTRPGLCGRAFGGTSSASICASALDRGRRLADHGRVALSGVGVVVAEVGRARDGCLALRCGQPKCAIGAAATSGAAPARKCFRLSFLATPKL